MSGDPKQCHLPPSDEVDYTGFFFLFPGVFQTLVVVFGLLGNTLILVVSSLSVNIFGGLRPFVVFLAICDCSVLVTDWCLFSLPGLMYGGNIPLFGTMVPLYFTLYPLCNAALLACVWANVLCSVERFFAVCKPLWHRGVNKSKLIRSAAATLTLLCVLVNVPRYFEYSIGSCIHNITRQSHLVLDTMPLSSNMIYTEIYLLAGHLTFATLGPFVILVLLNAAIWREVRRSFKRTDFLGADTAKLTNSTNSKQHNATQQLTGMFLLVSAKFVISYTMPTVLDAMHVQGDLQDNTWFSYLADINNVLVAFHSATNFVVYLVCHKRFRRACRFLIARNDEALLHINSSSRSSQQTHCPLVMIQSAAGFAGLASGKTRIVKQKLNMSEGRLVRLAAQRSRRKAAPGCQV